MSYAALFLSALLAATLLPAQSEAVLAGLLLDSSYDWRWLVLIATLGNTLGAVVNWLLGRSIGHFRSRRWFPVNSRLYERAHDWFRRYGIWSLLFSWVPFVGDPITMVAGVLRVGLWRFVALVAVGKAARYLAITAVMLRMA